jgi:hypothetical protein
MADLTIQHDPTTTTNADGTITVNRTWGERLGFVRREDPSKYRSAELDGPAVARRYGVTLSELVAWFEVGKFPRPIKNKQITPRPGSIGHARRYAWSVADLDAYDTWIREMHARQQKK